MKFRMPIYLLSGGLLLAAAGCMKQNPRVATTLNQGATLVGDLPVNPLQWKVVTSEIDHADQSMATLFGNEVAVQYARTNAQHDYPVGAELALVTWKQQEDPRWFGGNIPAAPRSVELVMVSSSPDHKPVYDYQTYAGAPLKKISSQSFATPEGRAAYLLSQRAAVMP